MAYRERGEPSEIKVTGAYMFNNKIVCRSKKKIIGFTIQRPRREPEQEIPNETF